MSAHRLLQVSLAECGCVQVQYPADCRSGYCHCSKANCSGASTNAYCKYNRSQYEQAELGEVDGYVTLEGNLFVKCSYPNEVP